MIRFKKANLMSRDKSALAVCLLVLSVVSGLLVPPTASRAAIGSVTLFPIPNTTTNWIPPVNWVAGTIGMGPDNNVWYTGSGSAGNVRVVKMTNSGASTTYLNPGHVAGSGVGLDDGYPRSIAKGSDGNIWYSQSDPNRIVKMSVEGTILNHYPLPPLTNAAFNLTLGTDGALWYSSGYKIGKITTSGIVTEYSVYNGSSSSITGLAADPNGDMWFTQYTPGSDNSKNKIGKVASGGQITTYTVPGINSYPYTNPSDIAYGPDGNLWFTEKHGKKIGKMTPSGIFTMHSLPSGSSSPDKIVVGSDGAMWFTKAPSGTIGRITASGVFSEYNTGVTVQDIIPGLDGAIWFLTGNTTIGRIATELNNQSLTFTSTTPDDAVVEGATYKPIATSSAGLPVAITVDATAVSICTINELGIVSYQAAGVCVLNANQPGDIDYNPALQVQQSFSVSPVEADTSITLDCTDFAEIGDLANCIITLHNNGPASAKDVSLTTILPQSLSGVVLNGSNGVLSGKYITWSAPLMAANSSIEIPFTAIVGASSSNKHRINAAFIQTSPDSNMSNNITDQTITLE